MPLLSGDYLAFVASTECEICYFSRPTYIYLQGETQLITFPMDNLKNADTNIAKGSFHVKSTQKNPYPHQFEQELVLTQCQLRH